MSEKYHIKKLVTKEVTTVTENLQRAITSLAISLGSVIIFTSIVITKRKEAMTLMHLTKVLELHNDDEACDQMYDRMYEIIEKEGDEDNIESEAEKNMKKYNL